MRPTPYRIRPPSLAFSRTAAIAAFGLLLILIASWLVATLDPSFAWGGDNAMYVMLARNLVEGLPYNVTGYIQNPYSYLAPPTYPPGFPVVLAPLYAAVGLDIVAFKIYVIALFTVALVLLAGYSAETFRQRPYGLCYGLTLIFLVGLSPRMTDWITLVLSEGVFVVLVIAALWALRAAYDRLDNGGPRVVPIAIAGGLLIACAIATRVFGVGLLASVVIYDLTRYRRLTRVGALALASACALWLAQTLWIGYISAAIDRGANNGYAYLIQDHFLSNLRQLPHTTWVNLSGYVKVLDQFWILDHRPLQGLVQLGVNLSLVVALLGWIVRVRYRYTVLEVFVLIYFASLLPWHAFGTRYLVPLIPFYFYYLVAGVAALEAALKMRFPILLTTLAVLAALSYGVTEIPDTTFSHDIRATASNGPAAVAAYDYIRKNTDDDAIFITRDPRTLALFTGRAAATYVDNGSKYRLRDEQKLIEYFHSIGARYLLATPYDPARALHWLAAHHSTVFSAVYRNQYFTVYLIAPADGSDRASPGSDWSRIKR